MESPTSCPQFRNATNADAARIRDIVFSVLEEYGLAPDPASTDSDLEDIEGNYHRRGGAFEVVVARGEVVGCAGLYPVDSTTCELRKMYLLPQCRGEGLGKQILERFLKRARELGFSRMVLETASVLEEAISLYRRYGFKPFQPEHLSARCDQAYELQLDGSPGHP